MTRGGPRPCNRGVSTTALEKARDELDTIRSRMRAQRSRAEEESRQVLGLAAEGAAAYGLGAWEKERARTNEALPTVMGLPPKLVIGAAAYTAGRYMGGDAGLALESAGRAALAVHAYETGRR